MSNRMRRLRASVTPTFGIWIGPEREIAPEFKPTSGVRKSEIRQEAKERLRAVERVPTMADLPPGSKLSAQTMRDILDGNYALRKVFPASYGNTPAKCDKWTPGQWTRWRRRHSRGEA
jgi:hypothetical protein